jgi:hypothetical protein
MNVDDYRPWPGSLCDRRRDVEEQAIFGLVGLRPWLQTRSAKNGRVDYSAPGFRSHRRHESSRGGVGAIPNAAKYLHVAIDGSAHSTGTRLNHGRSGGGAREGVTASIERSGQQTTALSIDGVGRGIGSDQF